MKIMKRNFGFGFGTGFVSFGFEKIRIRISKIIEKMDALLEIDIQGDPNQNLTIQMAITLQICIATLCC